MTSSEFIKEGILPLGIEMSLWLPGNLPVV